MRKCIEATPGTVDATKLGAYVAAGVNRISFGAQSFQSDELQWLGRIHGRAEIGAAVRLARSAGVQRLNLDLIYGLPGQSLASWRANVRAALALAPEHLSLYALTVEEGTPLADWVARGRAAEPDPGRGRRALWGGRGAIKRGRLRQLRDLQLGAAR